MAYRAASTFNSASGAGDVQAVPAPVGGTSRLRLMGVSAVESAGTPAAATFVVRNGTGATGERLVDVALAASASFNIWFGDAGISANGGIFLDRLTGSSTVNIFYLYGPEEA